MIITISSAVLKYLDGYSWGSEYDIKLDDTSCPDEDWSSCSYKTYHNCVHNEDVYLNCENSQGKLQLEFILFSSLLLDNHI